MRFFSREAKSTPTSDGGAVADVLKLAAERIDEIVSVSERAATDIRAASSERLAVQSGDGGQITRERIVSELADSLVKRADELRAEAAQLADVLERASGRLGSAPQTAQPTQAAPQGPPVTRPVISPSPDLSRRVSDRFAGAGSTDPSNAPGSRVPFKRRSASPVTRQPDAGAPSNDGLRLLATQMAVAGSSRDEIEARLRSEFGVDDPSSIFVGLTIPSSG